VKTKVFHVITKLELGGAQKLTLMTLERLPRNCYELALVSGEDGLLDQHAKSISGVKTIQVPELVREVRPVKDFIAFVRLWNLFRREKPTIVHTHSSKAGILARWAARAARVPIIFHSVHGFGFNDWQHPAVRRLYIWIERLTMRITTKIVVVSHANAKRGEQHGIFDRSQWVLCRDAISVTEFIANGRRRTSLAEWKIPEDRVVVGMVACFKPQKSPVDFIDVAARVCKSTDRAHFVMIGDGELRPHIEARIGHHGLEDRVSLLGWQQDMPEVYRNLDIVVLTSLWEGLPCVFSEAMAGELPIVATNVDGAPEAILDGQNGFLHQPHDIDGIAQSVLKLILDPDLRRSMGREGRSRVQEFDISTSVERLESAYKECLSAR
jgi:glycosyltransferase involved in cell wall biosynthesis